jgi:cytoskeletal protein RodZ
MEERGWGQPHIRARLEWRTLLLLLGLALGLYLTVDVIQGTPRSPGLQVVAVLVVDVRAWACTGGRMLRSSFSNESPNEGEVVRHGPSSSSSSTPRKNEEVSATSSTETRTSTTTTTVVDPKTGVETETTTTTTTVVTTVVAQHHRPQLPQSRFHTLLNPHSADAPTFDWSAPLLPLLPPDQAKRFLKEVLSSSSTPFFFGLFL